MILYNTITPNIPVFNMRIFIERNRDGMHTLHILHTPSGTDAILSNLTRTAVLRTVEMTMRMMAFADKVDYIDSEHHDTFREIMQVINA